MELFDVSMPVHPAMLAWPTGRAAATHRVVDEAEPRNSEWQLDAHAGTHVDAPLHWLPAGHDVEGVALGSCLGPCTVLGVDGDGTIDDVPAEALLRGHRVLFRTGNGERLAGDGFDPEFVSIGERAAEQLAAAGVALVGIDYLSVEAPDGGGVVHRVLLEAGVVLLEGLDLRAVEPGEYWLSALPVRLVGSEAAPVRAVLWR